MPISHNSVRDRCRSLAGGRIVLAAVVENNPNRCQHSLPPYLFAIAQSGKFKGLVNDGIQIKASFSEDGVFVISGSEDGQVR